MRTSIATVRIILDVALFTVDDPFAAFCLCFCNIIDLPIDTFNKYYLFTYVITYLGSKRLNMCHTVSPPVNDVIILVCYTGDIRLTVILLDNPGKLLEALCDYALYKSTFSYITLHYIT